MFTGVVLTGGNSTRMGVDKALLDLDGSAMARRVADALRSAGATQIFAVGGAASRLGALGLDVVADQWPGEGPLGAIITALSHAGYERAVILACDHAAPVVTAIEETLATLDDPAVDVAVPVVDGHQQFLHAAWRTGSLGALRARFDDGVRSVRGGARDLTVATIELADPLATLDLDSPTAVLRWRAGHGEAATLWPDGGRDVQVPQVTIDELETALAAGATLIDVREPDELEAARVAGGVHIALGTVVDRLGDVPTDEPVYVICAAGGRSQSAAEFYCSNGIDARNVMGGTNAWVEADKPYNTGPLSS